MTEEREYDNYKIAKAQNALMEAIVFAENLSVPDKQSYFRNTLVILKEEYSQSVEIDGEEKNVLVLDGLTLTGRGLSTKFLDLHSCDKCLVSLRGASFDSSNLSGTRLMGTDVTGMSMSSVQLLHADLQRVVGLDKMALCHDVSFTCSTKTSDDAPQWMKEMKSALDGDYSREVRWDESQNKAILYDMRGNPLPNQEGQGNGAETAITPKGQQK